MYTVTLTAVWVIQFLMAFLVLEAQPVVPQDFGSVISQIQQSVMAGSQLLLQAINDTVLSLTRVVFVTLLILGFFLYFTHLHRRLGKDLMFGGVVLAIISQFVIPAVTRA
jgi:hypothetical protein